MAQWKFQAVMAEAGIEDLTDPALNSTFVEQARDFLTAAQNPEADKEKLNELDESLVARFNELHTVTDEEDEEKVTAIRENQAMKVKLAETQKLLDKLEADLAAKDAELEETKKKIPVVPDAPPQPTEEEVKTKELEKRRNVLLATLNEYSNTGRGIKQTELIEKGVPTEKFSALLSFTFWGFTFDRAVFGQKWIISQ